MFNKILRNPDAGYLSICQCQGWISIWIICEKAHHVNYSSVWVIDSPDHLDSKWTTLLSLLTHRQWVGGITLAKQQQYKLPVDKNSKYMPVMELFVNTLISYYSFLLVVKPARHTRGENCILHTNGKSVVMPLTVLDYGLIMSIISFGSQCHSRFGAPKS